MISPTPIIIWYFFTISNNLLYLKFMLKMTLIYNYTQYPEIILNRNSIFLKRLKKFENSLSV